MFNPSWVKMPVEQYRLLPGLVTLWADKESRRKKQQTTGENYIMRSFILCTLPNIAWAIINQEG
jgi:hypothetical protein